MLRVTAILRSAERATKVPGLDPGPPLDAIAYEQSMRALDQQAGVLDELRRRTSTLIAVSALVATFLGGEALQAQARVQGPRWLLLAALVALLFGVAASVMVLVPTTTRRRRRRSAASPKPEEVIALAFSANVEVLLDHAEERGVPMPDTTRMHTARTLQLAWTENAPIISKKQRAFVWACVALLVQTTSWIAYLAIGREVI